MPALNIFKVFCNQRQHLVDLLVDHGMEHVDTVEISESGVDFTLELYFTTQPIRNPVKWIRQLKNLFAIEDAFHVSFAAAMLVRWNNLLYVVSYGTAHFFVSRFAEINFGIEIASRVVSNYKIKNSREFGGVRTKSIETYQPTNEIVFSAGEAVTYIKGVPRDRDTWGKTVSCGQSVQLRKRDFDPTIAHKICSSLENVLQDPIVNQIPRSIRVTDDEEIAQLDNALISDMSNGNYMVLISQQQLSGVDFLFPDRYEYLLKTSNDEVPIEDSVDLNEIQEIVNAKFSGDYARLLNAPVEAQEDGERVFLRPFITFVDYIDTVRNYYLEDGKWYKFDVNYLSNIRNAVNRTELDDSTELVEFDETAYQEWKSDQAQNSVKYREWYLNQILSEAYGYLNRDRTLDLFEGATVELADLVKDQTLYVVKIGKPQKLSYAIDQANAALRVIERNGFTLDIEGVPCRIQSVCLWLFLERSTNIQRISEINSLIFLMKLAHWRDSVLLAGLTPRIRISYRR